MTTSRTQSTVQSAFEAHELAIRVPDVQNREAKALHPRVREQIAQLLGISVDDTFLNGSYRRKTQIAPLTDIDIIVVLGKADVLPIWLPADQVLARVAAAACACEIVRRVEKVGVRAVMCVLWGTDITVDLVPALKNPGDDRLWLCCNKPEEGLNTWTMEHPRGQIQAAADANEASEGVYIRLVRIAKSWNCSVSDGDEKLLPSYAIEAAVHAALGGRGIDYAPGLAEALALLRDHLVKRWALSDPGNPENDVLERLDESRRGRAIPVVEEAAEHAERALGVSEAAALEIWQDLLGPTFPGPGQRTGAMSAALRAGTVGASAAGLSIGSPARAISKKPRSWRP